MNYNYVYLNTSYSRHGILDKNEYNAICLRDLEGINNIQVISIPLQHHSLIMRRIYNFCVQIDKKLRTNFQRLWYPFIHRVKLPNDEKLCFVFSTYSFPMSYISYLRKRYKNAKFIKVHRDLVSVIEAANSEYSVENMRKYFDLILSFDKMECRKYGFVYFEEIESKIQIIKDVNYPIHDVFFAGKAKDRMPKIMKAYHAAVEKGLKPYFCLTGVPKEDRIPYPGIVYADKNMPYIEMLYHSFNSKCLVDVTQGGAVGYTSRFLEAVMYNKLLFADNEEIKNTRFYSSGFIQVDTDFNNLDFSKVNEAYMDVDYKYQNEFSPIKLIELIDECLSKEEISIPTAFISVISEK